VQTLVRKYDFIDGLGRERQRDADRIALAAKSLADLDSRTDRCVRSCTNVPAKLGIRRTKRLDHILARKLMSGLDELARGCLR
jgi:hypothetical protein